VALKGAELHFRFKGKSGKIWRLRVSDRRIARIVRQIQDLPGQDLFQYLDEEGHVRDVTSADVNGFMRYVHPAIIDGYLAGTPCAMPQAASGSEEGLSDEERAVLRYLESSCAKS
jgi:DNA topoisomerase IB